jgi:DNA polymerase I-like protein with 3'-5' exonuclease and polymerase domains
MPDDWCLVAHVHDEWQTEVKESIADETARLAVQSIEEAGDILNLRCPITGEARVGSNWAETH